MYPLTVFFRPRFENRHGNITIFPKHAQAANFISQMSSLNLKFGDENFKVGFSIQNFSVGVGFEYLSGNKEKEIADSKNGQEKEKAFYKYK